MFRTILMISVLLSSITAVSAQTSLGASWTAGLMAHIEKFKRYPPAAAMRRMTGTTLIEFVVDQNGKLIDSKVEKTSCFDELDQEALAIIRRAAPFPPLPPEAKKDRQEFQVPLIFAGGGDLAKAKADCDSSQDKDKALGLHPPS